MELDRGSSGSRDVDFIIEWPLENVLIKLKRTDRCTGGKVDVVLIKKTCSHPFPEGGWEIWNRVSDERKSRSKLSAMIGSSLSRSQL